jgi:hypothetical protein
MSLQFSAATYSVVEGLPATIVVERLGPRDVEAAVRYSTADGPGGKAGRDYTATSGQVRFAKGVGVLTFTVPTRATSALDGPRSVLLSLSTAGAPLSSPIGPRTTATLTIVDNSDPGTFQFAPASYSVAEGSPVQLTVTRTGGAGGASNVSWHAVGGNPGDFSPTSGILVFAAGTTSKTLTLNTTPNTILDGNRSVTVTLDTPTAGTLGSAVTATVTIVDRNAGGVIEFGSPTQTVAENVAGGKVSVVVNRTGARLAGGVLVDYTVSGDVDALTLPPGTLTFNENQTTATIVGAIVPNATAEPDRSITLTLSNPRALTGVLGPSAPTVGGRPSTIVKIVDDEPRVQFSAASYAVNEGTAATITVTRTGSLARQVTVDYATGGGTGIPDIDYVPAAATVIIPANVGSRSFTVTTKDDGVAAGDRRVMVTLSDAVGASIGNPSTTTLTIVDRQSPGRLQFATASASVVEGGTIRVTVTRTGANLVGGVTVDWSVTGGTATDGDDFSATTRTLTFGPDVASQSFEITAIDDGLVEGGEFVISVSVRRPAGPRSARRAR